MACNTRDCFMTQPGRPVFENGTVVDICFSRQSDNTTQTLAAFETDNLEETLQDFLISTQGSVREENLRAAGGFEDFYTVASEDLLAFGEGTHFVERSVHAWSTLLLSLGIVPHPQTVLDSSPKVLDGSCRFCEIGGRGPRPPHYTTIYNIKEVSDVVKSLADPRVQQVLRE